MIPQQLTLKNFLSYRQANLDFDGIHTACICGPNGAGKSSLLEAMAWALWGECRAASEDDIIHIGESEASVDFIFSSQGQTYRVIRTRRRQNSPNLEFQVAVTPNNPEIKQTLKFLSLTGKGVRATQDKILEAIKIDCETFFNSAYLRQGKADEFMLKKPAHRKDVLANLLKLDQYEMLAEKAKESAREYKNQVERLEIQIQEIKDTLQAKYTLSQDRENLENTIKQLQESLDIDRQELEDLKAQQLNRENLVSSRLREQQQVEQINQEYRRLNQELNNTKQQEEELKVLLEQKPEIMAGYKHWQDLQAREEIFAQKFKLHQAAIENRQKLQEKQRQQLREIETAIQKNQVQIDSLAQQETEQLEILKQQPEVEKGLGELQSVRNRLQELDQLQQEVLPIIKRRQELQLEIDRERANLNAQFQSLAERVKQMQTNQEQKLPKLHQELEKVSQEILNLDKKKVYQQRVREKGQERDRFLKNLANTQQEYEGKISELDQKMSLLKQGIGDINTPTETQAYPPCPLCDRPLDEHHWRLVINKHQSQQEELRSLIWVVRGQLIASEKELKVLQEEYKQLENQLVNYQELREQRGRIQAQFETIANETKQLSQRLEELKTLEHSLKSGDYAKELYQERAKIDQQLQLLNYNEQTHALIRNQEKNLRWAEIRLTRLKDAENKLTKINAARPPLQSQLDTLIEQLADQKAHSPIQQEISQIDQEIFTIGYDLEQHDQIRKELRESQFWLTRYERLQTANYQYPQLQQRREELRNLLQDRTRDLNSVQTRINEIDKQLEITLDQAKTITDLSKQIQQRNQEINQKLSTRGRLEQQQQYLDELYDQSLSKSQELESVRKKHRIYQELAQAFGKNGIQAVMIDNVLPQLEAATNNILSRLSANQMHVQFITQKSKKGKSSKENKLIETLDILIADSRGTRSYETYSGGEAFRINFAIRLALAKLLAQRAGTALQMLIIDEGFGTQDSEGCDRLIAAINAIASDFACILTVTHIPHLKEAFQTRIEVNKSPQGSQIHVSI